MTELQPTCGHSTGHLIAQLVSTEKPKCRELGVLEPDVRFTNDSQWSLWQFSFMCRDLEWVTTSQLRYWQRARTNPCSQMSCLIFEGFITGSHTDVCSVELRHHPFKFELKSKRFYTFIHVDFPFWVINTSVGFLAIEDTNLCVNFCEKSRLFIRRRPECNKCLCRTSEIHFVQTETQKCLKNVQHVGLQGK